MAMKRAEMWAMVQEADRIEKAVFGDTFQQELIDGVTLTWRLTYVDQGQGVRCLCHRITSSNAVLHEVTPAVVDRYREIYAALEAWQRNEGEWPMARKP